MSSIVEEVLALRKSGGYFLLEESKIIEIQGADATAFLQARLSNDVAGLKPGQGQMTCLLDRKAHALAYGSLHRLGDTFWLLLDARQVPLVLEQFEQYRFREAVTFRANEGLKLWSVQGTKSALLLALSQAESKCGQSTEDDLSIFEACICDRDVVVIRRSLTGEPGLIIASDASQDDFVELAKELGLVPLTVAALEVARVEAGLLSYGVDFNDEQLLPETGLEQIAASYTKGCFQGQEVLARIKSFGAPRRGLVGLVFDADVMRTFAQRAVIFKDGEEIGDIRSNIFSPTLNRLIAFAYVQRELRVPDQKINIAIDGHPYEALVVSLPFYSAATKQQAAVELYKSALAEFAYGSEEKVISMLREVIELYPTFADAYETLGVVLSRHDELDEAISLMKRLEQLDPESVMAHTNLSVFYMQKGDKEAAEEEKAKAMGIRMMMLSRDMAADKKKQEEIAARKAAAEQRMDMFRQVLAIDSEDFLANSGLGSALIDAEKYEDAIPYLQKSLSVRANHTVSYLYLGEAYEKSHRLKEAIETYKKGIAVAAQRGDGEPMKEMRSRLEKLEG